MHSSSESGDGRLARNWQLAGRFLRDVTHDVNNQMGAAMAHAELLGMSADDARARESVHEIVSAVERSSQVLDSLAAIVSRDEASVQRLDVASILRDCMALFRRERERSGVSIHFAGAQSQAMISGIQTCLSRLVLQVLCSAVDAAQSTPPPRQVRVSFEANREEYLLRATVPGAVHDDSALSEAAQYADRHRGRLSVEGETITVMLPVDTGLSLG